MRARESSRDRSARPAAAIDAAPDPAHQSFKEGEKAPRHLRHLETNMSTTKAEVRSAAVGAERILDMKPLLIGVAALVTWMMLGSSF